MSQKTTFLWALLFLFLGACSTSHLRSGDKAARSGNWEAALVHYKKAEGNDPNNRSIHIKIGIAKKNVAQIYTRRGVEAVELGLLRKAIDLFGQALALNPDNTDAQAELKSVAKDLIAQGDEALQVGDLETAAVSFRSVHLVKPDFPGLPERYEKTAATFALTLLSQAKRDMKDHLCGGAFVKSARSLIYAPGTNETSALYASTQKCLIARNEIWLALARPGREALARDLFIHFMEAPAPFTGATLSKPGAPSKRNEAVLSLNVSAYQESEEVDKQSKTKNIESSSGRENPNYATLQKKITKIEGEISSLSATTTGGKGTPSKPGKPGKHSSNALLIQKQNELANAKDTLKETPKYVNTSKAAKIKYTVREVTRTVSARIHVRLTGSVIGSWAKTFEAEASATDKEIPAVHSADIHGDPLTIPTYEELNTELLQNAQDLTVQALKEALGQRRKALIQEGQRLEELGSAAEALEMYADTVFQPPRRWSHYGGKFLSELAEVDPPTLFKP